MNPDIISITGTFLLDNTTGPAVNIKDTTNYSSGGITNSQVKGNVTGKYGATIFHQNDDFLDPDINRGVADNVTFLLPVDTAGKAINAAYTFIYAIKVLAEALFATSDVNAPGATPFTTIQLSSYTQEIVDEINAIVAASNHSNVKIRFLNGSTVLATSNFTSCSNLGVLSFASTATASFADIDGIQIIADAEYSNTFSYSFCNPTTVAKLDVVSDCLASQLTATDSTVYPGNLSELLDRELKIQYPRYADGTDTEAPVTTSDAAKTIGPNIWSGNYTVSLITQLNYTQSDDLNVQYTVTGYVEHNVDCSSSICGLAGCISTLRWKYQAAKREGSAYMAELREQNFEVSLMVNDYNIAMMCKNRTKMTAVISELTTYLRENTGCDCGCTTDQTTGEPTLIYATLSTDQTTNLISWN